MPVPTDVTLKRDENVLSLTWDDGSASDLPIAYVRRWCPCASCQGHSGHVSYLATPTSATATGLEEVGAYAVRIKFTDGHSTGIYTWTWLHRLSPDSEPNGLKYGEFRRGRFVTAPDPIESSQPAHSAAPEPIES
ncbi:MAG: DUF971 domain-containing protein [Nannocystaceae bacterium]